MNIIDNKYRYKPLAKDEATKKYYKWGSGSKFSKNILEDVYISLRETDTINVRIPTSDCFYTMQAIRRNLGVDLSVYAVENLLLMEGMLAYRNYGIPDWYAKKWLVDGERLATSSSRQIIYATAKDL